MYYLSACNRDLLIIYDCYVFFFSFGKRLKHYEQFSQFHLDLVLKKTSPLHKPKSKCVTRKINLYIFDVVKNGQIFPSEVCYFQYGYKLQTPNKFPKYKNIFGRFSPFHFLQNILIQTSNICFKKIWISCLVLVIKFRRLKLY